VQGEGLGWGVEGGELGEGRGEEGGGPGCEGAWSYACVGGWGS
jgi:hypothetical protein